MIDHYDRSDNVFTEKNLNAYISNSIIKNWDLEAFTDYKGSTLLFRDVARRIAKLHILFEEAGLKPGDRIALCGKNSSNWGTACLAALTYGAVVVPILHEFKADNIHHIINHSETKLFFAGEQIWENLNEASMPDLEGIILLDDFQIAISRNEKLTEARERLNELFGRKYPKEFTAKDVKYYETGFDDMAMINYTSGSTGFSKGVMLPYRSLISNHLFGRRALYVMKPGDKIISMLPMAHMYGFSFEFFHEFLMGCHIYFLTPSIVLWSIGNEVLEQWSDAKADTLSLEQANLILNMGHSADQLAQEGEMSVNSLITARLAEVIKQLDPTRPVTAGCNEPSPGNHLFRSGAIDVIGYNYHNQNVPSVPRLFPGKPFIITESVSALMTRGFYEMPSDKMMTRPVRWDRPYFNETFSCSAYDNVATPWGNHHEENLIFLNSQPFVAGQYIWTGFDYIGEPTPYGWPARSSYFGIVDLAGFPKDIYYLYQSEWTDTPVLHLFPHWNWTPGEQIDMWCYYNNADEVELYINGKSQGVRSKDAEHLHVVWNVTFEPGTVKVVAHKNGIETASQEIHTAGEPAQIRLTPDRSTIRSNGTDLSFVTVEILDKDGNLCPNADNLVEFSVDGKGFIAGVDNGSPISLERFKDNKRKAFYGKCLVVLQNNGSKGKIKLKAVSEGLNDAQINIKCASKAK